MHYDFYHCTVLDFSLLKKGVENLCSSVTHKYCHEFHTASLPLCTRRRRARAFNSKPIKMKSPFYGDANFILHMCQVNSGANINFW
jgi:hypothetical protein